MEDKIREVVQGIMLDSGRAEKALAQAGAERKKKWRKAPDRLPGIFKALGERERRRDGFLELAADGLMPKADLTSVAADGGGRIYGALDLRVWANGDGSFKLTWLAGADLAETVWDEEETRWRNDRTSTR